MRNEKTVTTFPAFFCYLHNEEFSEARKKGRMETQGERHQRVLLELHEEVWQPLVLTEIPEPKDTYFIKYKFTPTSYMLVVTNMYHVWTQACERDEIKKARLVGCSSNPLVKFFTRSITRYLTQRHNEFC